MNATRMLALLASLTLAMAIATATAVGHVERSSYWPDPAADKSVKPAAGGKVPKARSLASALRAKPRGKTRVVCQRASLKKAIRSINSARKKGTVLRPSQGTKKLTAGQARRLKRLNRRFYRRCKFKSIQTAITKSRNNDRVVIMPGKYLEPKSRAKPTDDPKCAQVQGGVGRRPGRRDLPVPGELPERPEPDLPPGPRAHGQGRAVPAA